MQSNLDVPRYKKSFRFCPFFGMKQEAFSQKLLDGSEQCDQIGRFLEVLVNTFSYRSSQNVRSLFGYFCKKAHLLSKYKLLRLLFGQLLDEFGLFFIPTSGHIKWDHCIKVFVRNLQLFGYN